MVPRVIERAARCFVEDDSLGTSAELGYRFFLALVPFCLFLTSLSGFVATVLDMPDAAGRITSLVSTAVPSNVGGALSSEMQRVLSERRPGHLSLSLLFTLFAATGATNALIKAMNRAYAVAESRPFLRRYLLAVILTLFAAAAVIVGFTVLVAVRFFTAVVASSLGLATEHATFVGLLPLPIAVAALVLVRCTRWGRMSVSRYARWRRARHSSPPRGWAPHMRSRCMSTRWAATS